MRDLTHEECSERIEAYASDRLDASARDEVAAHVAECPDCSLELVAVQALMSIEVEPMTGPERERVSSAVRAAVVAQPRRSLLERFGPRFAPALGAVALVAIAAVALVSLPDSSDTPSVSSAEGGADEDQTMQAEAGAEAEAPAPASLPNQADRADDGAVSGGGSVATGGATADSAQQVEPAQAQALNARGNFTVVTESFSETGLTPGSLVPARVPRQGLDDFGAGPAALASLAPNERLAGLVEECAERTIATSRHPLVPSSAVYYADDVLVISFIWLDPSASIFNYELRGWVDGDCERISPIYRRGVLE